jgi:hypothetical protein
MTTNAETNIDWKARYFKLKEAVEDLAYYATNEPNTMCLVPTEGAWDNLEKVASHYAAEHPVNVLPHYSEPDNED